MSCISLISKERAACTNPLLCIPIAQRGVITIQNLFREITYKLQRWSLCTTGNEWGPAGHKRCWDNDANDLRTILIFPPDTIMDPACQPLDFYVFLKQTPESEALQLLTVEVPSALQIKCDIYRFRKQMYHGLDCTGLYSWSSFDFIGAWL